MSEFKVDYGAVKQAATAEHVIAFYAIKGLHKRGSQQWRGLCPLCQASESFVFTANGGKDKLGAFHCFKCLAGGDQLELVSRLRGFGPRDVKGVYEAALELHAKLLGNSSNTSPSPNQQKKTAEPVKAKRVGFDIEAYIKSLDPDHAALKPSGLSPETLREWNCGYSSSGLNRGRLALPIANLAGEVSAFVGLALGEEQPKLTHPKDFDLGAALFGLTKLQRGEALILVKAPLDVLRAAEACVGNCLCFLTEDLSKDQLLLLAEVMAQFEAPSISFM